MHFEVNFEHGTGWIDNCYLTILHIDGGSHHYPFSRFFWNKEKVK